jgi:hypothetical protein
MSEYSGMNTGGASCSYSSLSNYNSGYAMGVPVEGKVVTGKYIVPQWAAPSYADWTAKVPSCSGYADITNAYGADAGKCQTTYRQSICNPKLSP